LPDISSLKNTSRRDKAVFFKIIYFACFTEFIKLKNTNRDIGTVITIFFYGILFILEISYEFN
jgi:hypothetical protein